MEMRAHFEASISKAMNVPVSLEVMSVLEGLSKLREGSLDCLFSIGRIAGDDLRCVAYGSLRAGVLVSVDHPLATSDCVTLEELDAYPVINSPYYDGCGGSIFDVYMDRGLGSETLTPTSVEGYKAAMTEDGAFVFSAYLSGLRRHEGALVLKPISEADSVPIPQCLVMLRSNRNPLCRALERAALTDPAALMK